MYNIQPVSGIYKEDRPSWIYLPNEVDDISSLLCNISSIVDPKTTHPLICNTRDVGKFKSSIGSTNVLKYKYLQDDLTEMTESETDSDASSALYYLGGDFTHSLDDPLQVDIYIYILWRVQLMPDLGEILYPNIPEKHSVLVMIQQRENFILLQKIR